MDDAFKPVRYEVVRDNGLTYGRTPSSPASISPIDIETWKATVSPTFKHYFKEQYESLLYQYEKLVRQYQINQLVYESQISFEPKIGESYHLYERANKSRFLSMVSPDQAFWDGYIGTYKLTAQLAWEEI